MVAAVGVTLDDTVLDTGRASSRAIRRTVRVPEHDDRQDDEERRATDDRKSPRAPRRCARRLWPIPLAVRRLPPSRPLRTSLTNPPAEPSSVVHTLDFSEPVARLTRPSRPLPPHNSIAAATEQLKARPNVRAR